MVRMPLSPRTTASARRNRRDSPSFPSSRGHVRSVRSSWEPGALGGGKYSSSSSGYFDDDSENVDAYNTRSRLDAIKASHLRKPVPSPKRRFTPDRNSPTWRSVQRKSVFGDDYEEEPTRKTLASETSTERIGAASQAADATAKASLTSFVKSSKPTKQTISSCPSSDSTASSLIYSLDETHNAGSSISETISAAAKMLERVHESDEAEVPAKAPPTEDKDDGMTLGTLTLSLSEESSGKKAEELVAATLAECRLMLAMSPPPTPVAKPNGRSKLAEEKRKLQEETRQSQEEKQPPEKRLEETVQTEHAQSRKHAEIPRPEPASSLAGFLTCPTCAAGFQEGEIGRRPLHSFACDHIVCRKCVFDAACNSEGRMVACPECEAQGAFDTARPVVSRMYLSLVRRMNEELSSGEKEGEKEVVDGGKRQERQERQTVPTQICVDNTEDGDSLELTASASLTSLPKRPGAKGLRVDVASPTEFLAASHAPAVEEEEKTEAKPDNVESRSKGVSIGDKLAADAPTSLVEPTTPVSRAEFRFRQRKEKLAQSLERVNKILERSKAVQEAGRAERSAYKKVTEGGAAPVAKEIGPSRLRTELRVETGEIPAFSPIQSGKKAPLGEGATQLQLSSGAKRRAHKAKATNKPREAAASVPPPVISPLAAAPEPPANANQQWGSLDIFRVDSAEDGPENGAPKTIEFGADFGSSPMSSCDAGDTLFLLADNRPQRDSLGSAPIQSKVKSYLAKGGPLSVERRPQRLSHGDKLQCPQFLPSLNYSTMQNEADGMAAGLVDPEERVQRSPMWGGGIPTAKSVGGLSFLSSPGGRRMRKPKSGGSSGNSMFRQMALSFDEMFRPSNNNPNDNVVFGRLESPACPGEEPDCPSYAFSVASCSMSPSSGDDVGGFGSRVEDGPLGALVTHKPRKLHKRILKRFMKKGRK